MCVGDRSAIDELKEKLKNHFSIKDEGGMSEYLGCTVHRDSNGRIMISNPTY